MNFWLKEIIKKNAHVQIDMWEEVFPADLLSACS